MTVPGYDRINDPSPDVCTVARDGDTFHVHHYRSIDAKTPCCHATVTITDDDRRHEHGAEIAALTRASLLIQQSHDRAGAKRRTT
jgi:hypothetical protein